MGGWVTCRPPSVYDELERVVAKHTGLTRMTRRRWTKGDDRESGRVFSIYLQLNPCELLLKKEIRRVLSKHLHIICVVFILSPGWRKTSERITSHRILFSSSLSVGCYVL
jgi:hypothetical protein